MLVKLIKFRKGNVFVSNGAKWSKVGEVHEVPDDVGHALIGKYPDMLEAAKGRAKKAKEESSVEESDEDIDAKATKMATEYANKSI